MISLETWAEIRYLHGSEGLSRRAIARRLGISRDTVARAIASGTPPKYVRVSGPSAFDPFEPLVRELLTQFPTMPTSVIAERVGWPGSQSWFRKKVALLRPDYAPKDPADRLSYRPGDQAQCDLWFPRARIPLGSGQVDAPPVLVMVASFSRFITAAMIPSRQTPDLVAGMWSLLAGQLGAVPTLPVSTRQPSSRIASRHTAVLAAPATVRVSSTPVGGSESSLRRLAAS